jgi:ABC-type antimicrobial peptide transport system permease subunit
MDSRAALQNVTTLEQVVSNSIAAPRFYAMMLGIFGGIAVILAAIGIYGIMAYTVSQRTAELGIRMALGARRGDVLALVLRQGLLLSGIGISIGVAGALLTTRYLQALLYGLSSLDPVTFIVMILLFVVVSAFAAYVPAKRALRVDPLIAIRSGQ